MVKRYEQPGAFPNSGLFRDERLVNEEIDLRDFIVDAHPDVELRGVNHLPPGRGYGLYKSEHFVTLEGPIELFVSSVDREEEMQVTERVTVPQGMKVKFQNYQEEELGKNIDMGISPASGVPLARNAAVGAGVGGAGGAAGGQYLMENPWIGAITAIVGGVGGYFLTNRYSVERV